MSDKKETLVDLPDFEQIDLESSKEEVVDDFDSAVRMAFAGIGQGGGRIADAFWDLGYGRVCALNTTSQDLVSLDIEDKLIIGKNRGGAGKDPEEGRLAAKESYEDIIDFLMRAWGDANVQHAFVLVGGGGGSGTGGWEVLVDAAYEYCKATNVENPLDKKVGVIMTLPKRSEGARVQKNALLAVKKAIQMSEMGMISPLILVDNAKIHEIFPGLSVKKFWGVANGNIASLLHTFNLLANQNSEYNSFDKQDFKTLLQSGTIIFGSTSVKEWACKEDISVAVRQNLKDSLLAGGFDLSKATMAGMIVVAHDDVLSEIPMENIDYAFNSLGRAIGNEGVTLHSGIYEGTKPGMRVFTIIGGLSSPDLRIAELEKLSQ